MGIADELQKLEQLRANGSLTDDEFATAKTRLLTNPSTAAKGETDTLIADQLAKVRFQNELARIDREWEIERRQYQMVSRSGKGFIPTIGTGIATAIVGGILGIFWIVLAITITNVAASFISDDGIFSIVKFAFPLIGVFLTLSAIGRGIYCCILAQNYKVAFDAYKRRHQQALTNQDSPSVSEATDRENG